MKWVGLLCFASALWAANPQVERAREAFQSGNYRSVVSTLSGAADSQDAEALLLLGKGLVMTGDFKRAAEVLTRASEINDRSSDIQNWLGRAYGRRAETSNPFVAAGLAAKARDAFETAVKLDPNNVSALINLFEYYLEAPGILGGGLDKAQLAAEKIRPLNPSRYHFALALIAEKKKDFSRAEQSFRRAVELAPKLASPLLDLGRFLAKHARLKESEDAFARAEKLDPQQPRILYERATALVRSKTNSAKARELLQQYLRAPLGPDDPPVDDAQKLLKQVS